MICPNCKHISRIYQKNNISIGARRYRQCVFCSQKFVTFENKDTPETFDHWHTPDRKDTIEYKMKRARYYDLKTIIDAVGNDKISAILEQARQKTGVSNWH